MTASENAVTARLDALLAPWNRSDTPGLLVGVTLHGATIYRRGFQRSAE